jgi:integrase
MIQYVPTAETGVAPGIGYSVKGRIPDAHGETRRAKKPGRYRDGLVKGLLLQISKSGAKSWVLRYELHGKEHMMGLGSAGDYNLKEARERARAARQLLGDKVDPLAAKHAARSAAKLAEARKLTFREAAQRYFDQHESKWTNTDYRDQFLASLERFAFSVLGDMDVAAIDTPAVLRAIEPRWRDTTVTLDRVRNRIEQVLDWCVVRGHRPAGTNPARWKGHLDQVLPQPRKVAPVVHHRALPYGEAPAFMAELRRLSGPAARALEFLILTAARSGEVTGATWDEIDLDGRTWTVPGQRMKGRREHRVPLSDAAVDLLRELPRERGNPHVFIGPSAGSGLSHMSLPYIMQRMSRADGATIHGFRASFSTWAYESTAHAPHTIELSLAHLVGNEVERAYRRSSMYAKRVKLMGDWARYCSRPAGKADNVAPIRRARP